MFPKYPLRCDSHRDTNWTELLGRVLNKWPFKRCQGTRALVFNNSAGGITSPNLHQPNSPRRQTSSSKVTFDSLSPLRTVAPSVMTADGGRSPWWDFGVPCGSWKTSEKGSQDLKLVFRGKLPTNHHRVGDVGTPVKFELHVMSGQFWTTFQCQATSENNIFFFFSNCEETSGFQKLDRKKDNSSFLNGHLMLTLELSQSHRAPIDLNNFSSTLWLLVVLKLVL